MMQVVSRRTLKSFFEWMLNQRQREGGRRLAGIQSASTLGTSLTGSMSNYVTINVKIKSKSSLGRYHEQIRVL